MTTPHAVPAAHSEQLERDIIALRNENVTLRRGEQAAVRYIRDKVDQMLRVLGTIPLQPEELDDDTLLQLDPIGIISDSFGQVLLHLRRTNLQLEEARDEIRAILDSIGGGIMVLDQDMRVIDCNLTMREIFSAGCPQALGSRCSDLLCQEREANTCPLRHALTADQPVRRTLWEHDGRYYEVVATPIIGQEGERQLVVLYLDISERQRMELDLKDSQERYRDLFENATDLIQSVGPDGRLLYVNRAWRETLGYGEDEIAAGLCFGDLVHPAWRERYGQCLHHLFESGEQHTMEMVLLAKDGREVTIEGVAGCRMRDGKAVATRCIFRDVTEQRRLQQELLRGQKLESIGVLAGGIAHDFNNLLTAFSGNLSLARAVLRPGSDIEPYLTEMESALKRAQSLTQQLLTFAKGGSPVKTVVAPERLVEEVAGFTLRGSRSRLELQRDEQCWPVDADAGQISQVVQNVVLNASQAMPRGGVISIRLSNVVVGPQEKTSLAPGEYVRIAVRDEGCGIPAEHLQRIFDPYFSTKQGGSGLGLAISYAIMQKHRGLLTVDSAPGAGTTIALFLPAARHAALTPADQRTLPAMGRGRVLLMDDEEIIRKVGRQMLFYLGYEVTTARSGEEALSLLLEAGQAGTPFSLAILDLTIPGGMGGLEVMEHVQKVMPRIKAVVSSGYADETVMAQYRDHGFAAVLPKPYTLQQLAEALSTAFGE